MKKTRAFELLGTNRPTDVAMLIGITPQAVNGWPEELSAAISDRVLAVLARKHLPPHLIGTEGAPPAAGAPPIPAANANPLEASHAG